MNKNITIPITDSNCTQYYLVEYKLSTDTAYASFQWYDNQIKIYNLADSSIYNVRITRFCCDGTSSALLTVDVDTSTNSNILDTPVSLIASGGSGQIVADWGSVTHATSYLINTAQDSDFTIFSEITEVTTNTATVTGLEHGVTYYVRVKARASGYADSNWSSTVTATTT